MRDTGSAGETPRSERMRRIEGSLNRWLILVWLALVAGAVASFGLVIWGYAMFTGIAIDPIAMLGAGAPMGVIVSLLLYTIMRRCRRVVGNIIRATGLMAEGDFGIRLDVHRSGEAAGVEDGIYENLNRLAEQLESTEILHENFVADFSHEFKTPIASINGYANLLLDESPTDEERATYLRTIAEESDRLTHLARSTLLLSRLDAQSVLAASETFPLDEQIRRSVLALQPQWAAKRIAFDVDLAAVRYRGNEAMLKEVWINLIDNAVKFTPEGGTVTLRLVRDPASRTVRAAVRDTGPGMTPEQCKRIFDRYYQADPSHATKGCGVGLAIVRRIVELCGGSVAVESAPGAGSTFTVELPGRE